MEGLVVLIADSNAYTRRLTRMMLTNLGIKSIYESGDGIAALDAIRTVNPDVMILDWDMPVLDGREVMRIVRSPGVFPKPNLPIIMLTDRGLRSRVTDSDPARRARIPGQADLAEDAAAAPARHHAQSAADGARRQVLHSDAAPPRRPQGIHFRGVTRALRAAVRVQSQRPSSTLAQSNAVLLLRKRVTASSASAGRAPPNTAVPTSASHSL